MFDREQYAIRNKDVGTLVLLESLIDWIISNGLDQDTLEELTDLESKLSDILTWISKKPFTSSPTKAVM